MTATGRLGWDEIDVIDELIDEVGLMSGESCDAVCERCPYSEACRERELFWGRPAWEVSMGDDL